MNEQPESLVAAAADNIRAFNRQTRRAILPNECIPAPDAYRILATAAELAYAMPQARIIACRTTCRTNGPAIDYLLIGLAMGNPIYGRRRAPAGRLESADPRASAELLSSSGVNNGPTVSDRSHFRHMVFLSDYNVLLVPTNLQFCGQRLWRETLSDKELQ